MKKNKHEIYLDRVDFLQILRKYEDSQASSYTQQQLLLIAKGYFIQELYTECIALLKTIPHNNKAKILFEKQALLFKASHLLNPHNTKLLETIIQQLEYSQRFVNDKPFSQYHHDVFKQFRAFLESQKVKSSSFIEEVPESEEHINQRKNQGTEILQMQKKLQKLPKIQGFPCFLVQKNWRKLHSNFYNNQKNVRKVKNKDSNIVYVTQQSTYPGPITNFTIINHIFEVIPYENKSGSFLNIILFPGEEYQIVSKSHWQYLNQTYGGIPVRRTFQALPVTRFSNEVTYNQRMTVKLLIQHLDNVEIFQVPSTALWSYNVIPILWKRYGLGQLKKEYSEGNYKLVGQGKVFQHESQNPLKFITFQNFNVYNHTAEDLKFQNKLFHRYDFEKYSIENSPSKGLVGLTNDRFLCFMNSSLQCLSNTYNLSQFFLHNQYIQYLIFSKNNDLGSRGQITCAYADIIKQLWNLNRRSYRDAQINPSLFKEVFAKRFENFVDDSQQDAHQFLNFLLNCLHDDLNMHFKVGSNRILKAIKDSTNFDEVRKTYTDNYENNNKSGITELFKGYTYSTLKCLNCEAKYYNFDMHLTFPLPVPATNSSIYVNFISSHQKDGQSSIRYNVFLQNLKNVNDIIKKVESKQNNLSPKRAQKYKIMQLKQFFMFGLNKQTLKVQTYYDPDTQIQKLLNNQGKLMLVLCSVSKENNKNSEAKNRMIDVQIDSSQQNGQQTSQKLILVEYLYEDQRKGYPKLIYLDTAIADERLLQIVAENLPDQALKYSGNVATQKQKLDCIEKVKLQKVKGKPFQTILKVKLTKDLSLFQQKEKTQVIGQISQTNQFTLESCFNIFQQKDKIQQEQGWVCGKCKKISACEKQQKIYSVGSHIIIVLKRFKQGEKINSKIQYPIQNLDISKYIDDSYKVLNPNQKFIYDLYGVIIHRGNLNRGHYYSYCKNKQTNKWYLYDDQLVREEDDPQVVVSENAYVLFYTVKE